MPFDPEATGVIPRLDPASLEDAPDSPPADPADADADADADDGADAGGDAGADATTTFRIPSAPATLRIGGPPTDEQTPPSRDTAPSDEPPSDSPSDPSGDPSDEHRPSETHPSDDASPDQPASGTTTENPSSERSPGQAAVAPEEKPHLSSSSKKAAESTPAKPSPAESTSEPAAPPGTGTTTSPKSGADTPRPGDGAHPQESRRGEHPHASGASRAGDEGGTHPTPQARPGSAAPQASSPDTDTAPQATPATPATRKAPPTPAEPSTRTESVTHPEAVTPTKAATHAETHARTEAAATVGAPVVEAAGAVPVGGGRQGVAGKGRVAALVASAPTWLPVLLVLEGLLMYVLALKVSPGPLRGMDPADINGLGLISALPASAFVAILIMIVSFFVTVAQRTDRKFLLLFQIAAITFALHGAGALVAEEPRFPTAYIHAGFVEFIARTGDTAISIDGRMGWPGFFALFAFVTKTAGITDLTPILNWAPLLSNLLYLLPFVLILRQVVATTRARWFAALLFVLVQWIGQDYFSPQGFTFALYLVFVAILLRWFGRVEPRTKPVAAKGLRRLLGRLDAMTPGELANTGMFRADKLLMLMLMIALFAAATASHQITPFMMLGVLTAFLLFRRTSLTWALPFLLGLVTLAWISYQTVGFWAGQIDTIFGGLGDIMSNLQRNTGDRIEGSDELHAMVLQARLGILVVILGLAAVGLLRRLRRGVFDRAALILLCVPVLALALQSYGGEIGLRIYMFALPGACLLAAYAFFPNLPADSADVREETVPLRKRNVRFNPELTKKVSLVLAACFAVVFAMAFLVARYGNEKFERVTSGEVAAMHYVYEHDKPSARVVYLVPKVGPEVTPTLPWGERDIELVNFAGQALVHKDPANIKDVVERMRPGPESPRNTYLVVSKGQVSYLQLNDGFPADWGQRFRAALDASPDLKRVYSNEDAALYTWGKFVRGTEIPDARPWEGRGEPTSPWTPYGVAALAVTWMALFGYEVIRLNGPRRAPRARKWLIGIAVPTFVVAVGVVVERFVYIAGIT